MAYYLNIYKDASGREWCESVFTDADEALDNAIETDGYMGHSYICTLTDSGKYVFTDADRKERQQEIDDQAKHDDSLARWYNGPRHTAY